MVKKTVPPFGLPLMTFCVLAGFMFLLSPAHARNPDLSNWVVNLSEGPDADEPASRDEIPEIVVDGQIIHAMWIAGTGTQDQVFYRRSLDKGQTWEPKQGLFTMIRDANRFDGNQGYRRLAVSDGKVHIVVNHGSYSRNFSYFRSTDKGSTFDPVYQFTSPMNGSDLFVSAEGGRVTIGYLSHSNYNDTAAYELLLSDDGGATFVKHTAWRWQDPDQYGGHPWDAGDMQRVGDTIAVLYKRSNYSTYSQVYVAASNDGGQTFTNTKLSFPSNTGQDQQGYSLQDYHYVPKIAVFGETIFVTWQGLDASGVSSIFLARSGDGGVTWDPTHNLTEGVLPAGKSLQKGQETLAAAGNFVYSIFLSTVGDVYARSSDDGGATFSDIQKLTTATPYTNSGWWPVVQIDPSDATGATAVVFWSSTGMVKTQDGGATFTKPLRSLPMWGTSLLRPQSAMDSDGVLHYVLEGQYPGGSDIDIFYRAMTPAPRATQMNSALSIFTSRANYRWDNMSIPASAGLAFDTRLTAEAWVYPYGDGDDTGTTSEHKPVFYQQVNGGEGYAYSLGTWKRDGRQAIGNIITDVGQFWVHPSAGTEGLVPDGAWSHLALTYDAAAGAGNLKLYLNGTLIASTTATGALKTGDGLFFVGRFGAWDIDEVRLWSHARSADDIVATMHRELAGTEPNLAAYYNFNDTTKDITGNGHDGLLMYQEGFVAGAPVSRPEFCWECLPSRGGWRAILR